MKKIFTMLLVAATAIFLVSCGNKDNNLIISKYVQNDIDFYDNQAIEIYNPSKKAINLKGHSLLIYSNGNDEEEYPDFTIELTGKLESKKTLVIVHEDATQELLDKADILTSELVFDGNDVIHLLKGKKVIDLIHDLGDILDNFKDEVYVRRDIITSGNSKVSAGGHNNHEWDFYVPWHYEVLGTHPVKHPEKPLLRINTAIINPGAPEKDQYPEMVKVQVISLNDGDTASFTGGFSGDARVRFLGIDTPELDHSAGNHQPFAVEATDNLKKLLKSDTKDAEIYLQFEASGRVDNYSRTIAYVWSDGLFTNYEQVLAGYTGVFSVTKDKNKAYDGNGIYLFRWLNRGLDYAKENRLGIHG